MDTARIAELLDPFLCAPVANDPSRSVLSINQLQHISTYIDILIRWNARINLTAIREPDEIVRRHFGESLFAARHLFAVSSAADSVADVGSGPGFPGLPMKIWAPHVSLTLIESSHKKAAFLREVARALTLTDVNIQNIRAESLTATFNLVTLRAVERFEAALAAAAPLVAPQGRLALLISSPQAPKAHSTLPALSWSTPIPIPESNSRILLTGTAPAKF